MKNLIGAVAILLISLTACKNSNNENTQTNEVTTPVDTSKSNIKPGEIGTSDSAGTTSPSGY